MHYVGLVWVALLAGFFVGPDPAAAQVATPPAEHVHAAPVEPGRPDESSGTAWLPAATPMFGLMKTAGDWQLMLHANAFAQYLQESGEEHRRGKQFGSINWIMGMAGRPAGAGRFALRGMVSVEPWTIAGCGYPDLLATGEVCNGDSLHDVQHPHDLFMELTVSYDRPIGGGLRWHVYGGPAGEPALGPPGFPHRPSALPNPIAPIAHHWLDATHITFGVITTGISGARWKGEVSAFNGREPDEERAGFDLAPLDSVAARLSFLPSARWALQVSAGHLREAEAGLGGLPGTDVTRATASAIHHGEIGDRGLWATTFAYGVNSETAVVFGEVSEEMTHALLIESSVSPNPRHTWFARFEIAGKPAHDLHAHEFRTEVFTVSKLQGGYVRHLPPWRGWLAGAGFSLSASILPASLAPRYGGPVAGGFGLFFSIRPASHRMSRSL